MLISSDCLPLKEIISQKITHSPEQRITFAEYMDLVLYHPQYGYYNSDRLKIGAKGDFFTSSSLGEYFGELLAEQLIEMLKIIGFSNSFALVEVGGGSGNLAADILNYLKQKYVEVYQKINYIIVEASPNLIEQQKKYLKAFDNIRWKTWQEIDDNSLIGCIFSNELVDAFPVHRVTLQNKVLKEIYVSWDENQFKEVIQSISTPKLLGYFDLNYRWTWRKGRH